MHIKDFCVCVYLRLRELIFPADCALCGKTLLTAKEAGYGICADCAEKFSINNEPRCSLCGKPLISEIGLCIKCKKSPEWHFDSSVVIFPYSGKYRELLTVYKFGKRKPISVFLAEKLFAAKEFLGKEAEGAIWVPVPPRAGKLKEVFWDQVEAIASNLKQIKVVRCLKRLPSRTQKELDKKERELNLIGKIQVTKTPPNSVILFDDVFTTGSTLSACAKALKDAGTKKVFGLCLFYD